MRTSWSLGQGVLSRVRGYCEQALAAARPRWIDHMLLNEIFDGDMAYLAKASQYAKVRAQHSRPSSSRTISAGIVCDALFHVMLSLCLQCKLLHTAI